MDVVKSMHEFWIAYLSATKGIILYALNVPGILNIVAGILREYKMLPWYMQHFVIKIKIEIVTK